MPPPANVACESCEVLVPAATAILLLATACSSSTSVTHADKASNRPTARIASPISDAASLCDPKYQILLPMPPPETLKEPLTYAALNVALQPAPPGVRPKVSAAAAWRTAAQFGLPDDQTGLVLALFTSEFPERQTAHGFKSMFVRTLAWVVTAAGLISSEQISVPPGSRSVGSPDLPSLEGTFRSRCDYRSKARGNRRRVRQCVCRNCRRIPQSAKVPSVVLIIRTSGSRPDCLDRSG